MKPAGEPCLDFRGSQGSFYMKNVNLALIHTWFRLGGNERKAYFQRLCSMSIKSFLFQLTFKLSYGLLSEALRFHLAVVILLLMRNGIVANTLSLNCRPYLHVATE